MATLKPIFLPLVTEENTKWEIDMAKSINELIIEVRRITEEYEARIKALEP